MIPDDLTDTSVASVLAAAAAAATSRGVDLQPRHQIGDRVAAGVLARGLFHDEFCDVRFFSERFFSDRFFSNRFGGRRFASPRGPAVTG